MRIKHSEPLRFDIELKVRKERFNKHLKPMLERLRNDNNDKRKKRLFLLNYASLLNLDLALRKTKGMTIDEYFDWMATDPEFKRCYEYLRTTKYESVEFLLLCKAGFYGTDYQNRVKYVDVNAAKKLMEVYLENDYYRRLAEVSGGRKDSPTGEVLGGGEGNPTITIKES